MDEKVKFDPILIVLDQSRLAFIKSLLSANGIEYFIDNENGSVSSDNRRMTLMVLASQKEKTEKLLREIE